MPVDLRLKPKTALDGIDLTGYTLVIVRKKHFSKIRN